MTESNQGPATPGTAPRCEVCNRPMRGPGCCLAEIDETCAAVCLRLGYERLKAENASLLESLRAAEKERDDARAAGLEYIRQTDPVLDKLEPLSDRATAAEQRAEAAEKRSADLMGALRDTMYPALFAAQDFLRQTAGSWAAPHSPLCYCMEDGGVCPAPAIREEAKALLPKLDAALRAAGGLASDSEPAKAAPEAVEKLLTDCDAALHDEERLATSAATAAPDSLPNSAAQGEEK